MAEEKDNNPRLPLPKWCFVLLGMPTFFMPLAYSTLVVYVLGWIVIGLGQPAEIDPGWLKVILTAALYVTFVLWPIYAAWVIFTKRLTIREKCLWLFIVLMLNMLGMPIFYVFMLRRYLGLEGKTSPRDEADLDKFLMKCSVGRDRMTAAQLGVLRKYCRAGRYAKWSGFVGVIFGLFMVYSAAVYVPKKLAPVISGMTPYKIIVVDGKKATRNEITDDVEIRQQYIETVMMLGAIAGVWVSEGLFLISTSVYMLRGGAVRKELISFIKAGRNDQL
jgi:hypothetical protein